MSEQENLRTVEKIFAALNARQLGAMDEIYTDDYKYEAPGVPGAVGLEAARGYVSGFITAFPDLHFELKDKVAQGDLVAVSWVSTGTHSGPLRTPTGALGGSLAAVRPDDLAAVVIKALLQRHPIDPTLVEEVYLGCANQAGAWSYAWGGMTSRGQGKS